VKRYDPIVVSCEMGRYGYWVAVVSTAPGRRATVTITKPGITREQAVAVALANAGNLTPTRRYPWHPTT